MTILVTGGSGFIGSYLIRSLLRGGQNVRVLLRPNSKAARLEGLAVERAIGVLENSASLMSAVEGASAVYHLAGEGSQHLASQERLTQVNAEGTSNLLKACKGAGVERVVHVSSAVTFGPTTQDQMLTEESPPPVGPASPYAQSKQQGEAAALASARGGIPVLVVCPTLVLGPDSVQGPIANALKGRPRWVMPGGINVVDIADVVFCLEAAMDKGEVGKKYIVGAYNLSWSELYQKIDVLLEHSKKRRVLPKGLLHLAAWAGCRWPRLLPSPHSLHWQDIFHGRTSWYFDTSLARETFQWTPKPLDLTLEVALSPRITSNSVNS